MAMAQTVQAMKGGQKGTAVLDLKSAYDTVRRDLLFERCAKVLPDHITAMISHTLQTLTVTTLGDDTKTEAKIDRGETQGGPASPTLFNIYPRCWGKAGRTSQGKTRYPRTLQKRRNGAFRCHDLQPSQPGKDPGRRRKSAKSVEGGMDCQSF